MAPFENWDKLEEDDEEELSDDAWLQGRSDAVLFAIDSSDSMLELRDDGKGNQKSHMQLALEGCRDLQKRKATVGPNDAVGIMIFNTDCDMDAPANKTRVEIKNYCHVYQPVGQVSAPKIQDLMELLDEAAEDSNKLREMFPPKQGGRVPMGDVFTSCNWMLRDGAPNISAKRLFLITDEDDPHPGNPQLLKTAQNTMFDLRQLGVMVQTFFISPHDKPFKIHKFYLAVLADGADDSEIVDDVVTSFDTLLSEMRFREMPKRSLWSVGLHLGERFTIGVKGYGLVTEQRKPVYSYRSNIGREQEEVKSRTVYLDEELQFEVDRSKIVYGMSLGAAQDDDESAGMVRTTKIGSKVFFTADEVREFRTMGMDPGIKLLGFKDLDQLTFEDNVKHSFFIYPDELAYTGSTRAFSALLNTMVSKKKLALVLALLRRNSSPAFYAMLAQPEKFDGLEHDPPGFHLIQLPFADDIREAPYKKACRAEESTREAAVAWIEKLKMKNGQYNADDNPNPALQLHYAQLEALAFNEEFDAEGLDDFTAPPTTIIKKRAGTLIAAWKEAVDQDESAHKWFLASSDAKKRKPTAPVDESEIRSRYDDGNLKKLTVDQMKEFLKSKSISVTGKKADLMERLGDWFDAHPE